MFLHKTEIEVLLKRKENALVIKPLLDVKQIGEMAIDFRLGYNFLASIQGRSPFIDASLNHRDKYPIDSLFRETRRKIGETFLFHSGQTILASSLEFVKLPTDVFAELSLRSSYLRLGLSLSAIVQPGYCGCISIELTNANSSPINLTVGAAILQARLYKLDKELNYFSSSRKYVCQVRPIISAVNEDSDLLKLNEIWKANNHKP